LISDTMNYIAYFLFRPLFSEFKATTHELVVHAKSIFPKNKIKENMVNRCKYYKERDMFSFGNKIMGPAI
jgi:hypothetical protein